MSELIFGRDYADHYDLLYRDKDYESECNMLEGVFKNYGSGPIESILDLGCGTGNHSLILALRGYHVTGVDKSPDMLEHARQKLGVTQSLVKTDRVTFIQGDVRKMKLERSFDAAIMMFAVLGYQLENADVLAAFSTIRDHLRPGGLLLLDAWYGPGVLIQRPQDRIRAIRDRGEQVLRTASSALDTRRHLCTVRYHMWRLVGDRLAMEVEEEHCVRFFFPRELEFFLEIAGFRLIRLGAFPNFEHEPDESTWNVLAVASAV